MGFAHAFGPGMGGVICNTDQKSSAIKEEFHIFSENALNKSLSIINFTCRIKHIYGNELVMKTKLIVMKFLQN